MKTGLNLLLLLLLSAPISRAQSQPANPPRDADRPASTTWQEERERLLKEIARLRAQQRANDAAGNAGGVGDIKTQPYTPGKRPASIALPHESISVTDEQIGKSIQKGVDWLLKQFDQDGMIKGMVQGAGIAANFDKAHFMGTDALAVYALLQCGLASDDPRLSVRGNGMKLLLDQLRKLPPNGSGEVYARALRIAALAVHNRPEDRQVMLADTRWLIDKHREGSYTYGNDSSPLPPQRRGGRRMRSGDNSNSQYGLLGVWLAAEVGVEVPQAYWKAVEEHWVESQMENGQWGYMPSMVDGRGGRFHEGTYAMTLAGIASLFVTHDYLDAPRFGMQVGRPPLSPNLARGLAWLESGTNWRQDVSPGMAGWGGGYNIYGLERVGLASGFKYIGGADWYRELASTVINWQQPEGSFGDLVETCYSMLFLARGRHPILMNKLRFDGAWANRPRDVSNLTRFARGELERPLNWQIVPADRPYQDWLDAPVLYLASHQPPRITQAQVQQIKAYIEAGGLLFTHADGNSPTFTKWVTELRDQLAPTYEWHDLPADHELFTLNFQVNPPPKLKAVSNGARILMLHSTQDIAQQWQLRAERLRSVFDLGVNLFLYAAGKRDFRNRLSSPYVPEPLVNPSVRMPVARVKYAGNWDPEPYALPRFSRVLQHGTSYGLDAKSVEMDALDAAATPFAFLTGTATYTPTDAEIESIRKYVNAGGVLLIDSTGGATGFAASVAGAIIPRAFAGARPALVSETHPLLMAGADAMLDLTRPQLRPHVIQKLGRAASKIEILRSGKGAVIVTPLDLTLGLVGANTFPIMGYQPAYAEGLVRNALLWAWDGMPEKSSAQ